MDSLYSVMQGLESRLGGGEGVEGIYGSITATGMHKVLDCMKHNCGLGRNSTLVDIGAGLGRPLLHALMLHGVAHGYGVELDRVKVAKAEAFCKGVISELALRGVLSSTAGGNSGGSSGRDASTSDAPAVPAAAAAAGAKPKAGDSAEAGAAAGAGGLLQQAGEVLGSQGSCLGSQAAEETAVGSAGRAAAAAAAGEDVSDDTQAQIDSSQTGPAAAGRGAEAAPAQQPQQAANAAGGAGAAAAVGGKKGGAAAGAGGGAAGKVKGQPLLFPANRPIITCAAIEQIASLDPGTHAYSFWEGVPLSGKKAFGRLFRTSRSMRAVAVVQRAMRGQAPEAVMAELGFGPLLLIKAFPVSMSGSGRSFQAYVFSKVAPPSALLLARKPGAVAAAAAAGEASSPEHHHHQQQQQQPGSELGVLASSTKPPKGSRLQRAGSSGDRAAAPAAADAADSDGSPDQQQQEALIPLLTEQSVADMQQQQEEGQGCSPAKRAQPFLPTAAAAADGDGSPSKKQKGVGDAAAAAAAEGLPPRCGSGLYGLRPRQLSSSFSSGGSSSSSRATSAATTGTTTQRSASGRRAGLRSSSSNLSRGSSGSMSVDQPFVGGSSGGGSNAGRGTRSTAVSGGGSRSRGRPAKQQLEQASGDASRLPDAAGGAKSSRRVQRGAGGSSVSAAVSEARAAVAELDV